MTIITMWNGNVVNGEAGTLLSHRQIRQSMIIITMWNGNVVNGEAGILLGHRQGKDGNCNDVEWQCGERGGWNIVESQTSQVE